MNDYKENIKNCIDYLNSVRYPCNDWKEDKVYFDRLEKIFLPIQLMKKLNNYYKN